MEIRLYHDSHGRSPFRKWYLDLDSVAARRISMAIARLEDGNTSQLKSLGSGLHECKIDYGPGFRIYLGMDGPTIVVLVGAGDKGSQAKDIQVARQRWADYKRRKDQPE